MTRGHDHEFERWRGVAGAFVLFAMMAVAGALLSYAAVEDYARARASVAWPTVDGVILSTHDGKVRYAWFDGDANHVGERVHFKSAAFRDSGLVYEPGQIVKARLSPENGSIAVLEPGGSPILFALALGAGAFLVFIGLAGLVRLAMKIDGLSPAHEPQLAYRRAAAE
jgi:Protein of unknown function (DUF3592)